MDPQCTALHLKQPHLSPAVCGLKLKPGKTDQCLYAKQIQALASSSASSQWTLCQTVSTFVYSRRGTMVLHRDVVVKKEPKVKKEPNVKDEPNVNKEPSVKDKHNVKKEPIVVKKEIQEQLVVVEEETEAERRIRTRKEKQRDYEKRRPKRTRAAQSAVDNMKEELQKKMLISTES